MHGSVFRFPYPPMLTCSDMSMQHFRNHFKAQILARTAALFDAAGINDLRNIGNACVTFSGFKGYIYSAVMKRLSLRKSKGNNRCRTRYRAEESHGFIRFVLPEATSDTRDEHIRWKRKSRVDVFPAQQTFYLSIPSLSPQFCSEECL